MRLEQYLAEQDIYQVAFAEQAGLTQNVVSRLCRGYDANGKVWAKVTAASRGRVHPCDHFPPPKRKRRVRGAK